jgi:hypothetical protein
MSTTSKETKVKAGASKEAAPSKHGTYRGNQYKPATTTVVREQKFSGKSAGQSKTLSCSKRKNQANWWMLRPE